MRHHYRSRVRAWTSRYLVTMYAMGLVCAAAASAVAQTAGADPGGIGASITNYLTTGNVALTVATGLCLMMAGMLARGHHTIEAFLLVIGVAAFWFKGGWIATNWFGVGGGAG